MGVLFAQELQLVRREIDDQQAPAALQQTRRLSRWRARDRRESAALGGW